MFINFFYLVKFVLFCYKDMFMRLDRREIVCLFFYFGCFFVVIGFVSLVDIFDLLWEYDLYGLGGLCE